MPKHARHPPLADKFTAFHEVCFCKTLPRVHAAEPFSTHSLALTERGASCQCLFYSVICKEEPKHDYTRASASGFSPGLHGQCSLNSHLPIPCARQGFTAINMKGSCSLQLTIGWLAIWLLQNILDATHWSIDWPPTCSLAFIAGCVKSFKVTPE